MLVASWATTAVAAETGYHLNKERDAVSRTRAMENEEGNEKGREKESSENVGGNQTQENPTKGKACIGFLYYSSSLKSKSRNPLCVGLTRSLPQVKHVIGESEIEASKKGRSLADFRYACAGYSVYADKKDPSTEKRKTQTGLPICAGLEVLVDKRVTTADSATAHVHNKEDAQKIPQHQAQKPAHPIGGEDFLNRFYRNATVVAMGVAKNLLKVANNIKERVDDILYPNQRRPK
ncbi:hypothetical protein NMG60_11026275 [Bertholletia excelsa]